MKKYALVAIIAFTVVYGKAQQINNQNPPNHISFYEQVIEKQGDVQQPGGAQAVVYKQIASRHELWDNPGSAWAYNDSALFTYNINAQNTLTQSYYYITGMWTTGNKNTTTYNGNGTIAGYLLEIWVNHLGAFRNYNRYTETYDANNNNIQELRQNWDTATSAWVNVAKYTKAYDGNNYLIEYTAQVWNTGTSNWDNYSHDIYTRDANGNMLTLIDQSWNSSTSTWDNASKYLYTYDANNRGILRIAQTWNSGSTTWVNTLKYTYTYDGNGNQTFYEVFGWNSGASAWDNVSRYTYTYDGSNKQIAFLQENWNTVSSAWNNAYRGTYTYNGSGDNTAAETFQWYANTWNGYNRSTYAYDGNRNRTYEMDERFNTTNITYENYSRRYFYYQSFNVSDVTGIKNELNAGIFPNPAQDIHVQFGLSESAPVTINVYDDAGRILITQSQTALTGTNNLKLETGTIASGNYFVQLVNQNTGQSSVLKFVKQ